MKNRRVQWICECECGTVKEVDGGNLRSGASNGCGCQRGQSNLRHGQATRKGRTGAYNAWRSMRTRVLNPQDRDRLLYKGITISPRWDAFDNFYEDMGDRPEGKSLDRTDNSKGYAPENCRWATRTEQNRNTRRTVWVMVNGERVILKDAAARLGVSYAAIYAEARRKTLGIQAAVDSVAARRLQPQ